MCKEHQYASWTEVNENCQKCIKYSIVSSITIESGKLPTGKEVLSFLITKKAENTGKRVNNEYECTIRLALHWIYCSVYPMTIQGIQKRLVKMLDDFKGLKKCSSKTAKYWENYDTFVQTQTQLFDIIGSYGSIKAQERFWGAKMEEEDTDFYKNMKMTPQRGYCSKFTDRKWEIRLVYTLLEFGVMFKVSRGINWIRLVVRVTHMCDSAYG